MTSSHRTFTFFIDRDSPIDTLEAVLAIARRGQLHLSGLHVLAHPTVHLVVLGLTAPDSELLDLFEARLGNQIGVADIRIMVPCS
jgi:hypothetical protein